MRGFLWALAWVVSVVVALFGFFLISFEWASNVGLGIFLLVTAGGAMVALLMQAPKDRWPYK